MLDIDATKRRTRDQGLSSCARWRFCFTTPPLPCDTLVLPQVNLVFPACPLGHNLEVGTSDVPLRAGKLTCGKVQPLFRKGAPYATGRQATPSVNARCSCCSLGLHGDPRPHRPHHWLHHLACNHRNNYERMSRNFCGNHLN